VIFASEQPLARSSRIRFTTCSSPGRVPKGLRPSQRPTYCSHPLVEEVKAWQARPLEQLYPIVYLDALMRNWRASGKPIPV
jgi:Transposase, Mutator family